MKKSGFDLYGRTIMGIISILLVLVLPAIADAQKRMHTIFFEGTDHELHVYRIYGKEPGKTLLLIGGIQGDEPGGFLSADLYADTCLAKGNLIVVPRANFQSIVLNRREINEDMNRKFAEDQKTNYETKIVAILKKLISESDGLLNLHDGSGFYSEKWEGPDRNPKRYGQSIISDCERYMDHETGQTHDLGALARSVANQINISIPNPRHHFHFNNHQTSEPTSLHKEQRKSATYYALYTCGIPAFGIEASKSLPLATKVLYHNLAINAFMERFGIVPETPGITLDPPVLRYLVVSVNDSLPIVVNKQQTLNISSGDTIMISHIEANYERGLSADIIGSGTINDTRKKISITAPTKIVVRKDYYPCGSIYIALNDDAKKTASGFSVSRAPKLASSHLFFRIKINGMEQILKNNDHVKLILGDAIEIVDVISNFADPSNLVVNFKGFVGDLSNNTGEDRGYVIQTDQDLKKRYSLNKKGKLYQVVVKKHNATIGRLFIELEEPSLKYLIIKKDDDNMQCVLPGDTAFIDPHTSLELIDINTNVKPNSGVKAFIANSGSFRQLIKLNESVPIHKIIAGGEDKTSCRYRMVIERAGILLGSIFLNFEQETHHEE